MKRLLLIACALLVALVGAVAAGPYLTLRAMDRAIAADDPAALSRQIDFPTLRTNLRAQAEDALARQAPQGLAASVMGAFGPEVANTLAGSAVDALATPAGVAALMQGRGAWNRLRSLTTGAPPAMPRGEFETVDGMEQRTEAPVRTPVARAPVATGLAGATHRFEAHDRFVATALDADGRTVTLVLTRRGLRWKLSDVRLSH